MCWAINPRGFGVSVDSLEVGATETVPLGMRFEALTDAAGRVAGVGRAVEVVNEGRAMKSGLVNQAAVHS